MDFLEFASEMLRDQCDWLREKRLHPRIPSNRGGIVLMLGTNPRLAGASILDWSTMGMKIQHSLPLKPRQKVKMITSERQWDLRVAWVANYGESSVAGLRGRIVRLMPRWAFGLR